MTVYFSMPFYPVVKKTYFYNGHLALSINNIVYQIFNPDMLKSNFLVSKMPVENWLYKEKVRWADKDRTSNTYRFVNLYGKSEIKRTLVYFIQINDISKKNKLYYKEYFKQLEERYQKKQVKFSIYRRNCASLLNPVFYKEGILKLRLLNFIPVSVFKNIIKACKSNNRDFTAGKIEDIGSKYRIHKFCLGIFRRSPEKALDSILKRI